jgi:hypothetical protein
MISDDMMIPVNSSTITRVGYDENAQELYVEFKNGGLYLYQNVGSVEYDSFIHAPSLGQYLHYNIKPVYPCTKL